MVLLWVELRLVGCRVVLGCCSRKGLDLIIAFSPGLFVILVGCWALGRHFAGTIAPTLPSVISYLAVFGVFLHLLFLFLLFFCACVGCLAVREAGEDLNFIAPVWVKYIPVALLLRVWTNLGGHCIFLYGWGDSFHNPMTVCDHFVYHTICLLDVQLSLGLHMLVVHLWFLERGKTHHALFELSLADFIALAEHILEAGQPLNDCTLVDIRLFNNTEYVVFHGTTFNFNLFDFDWGGIADNLSAFLFPLRWWMHFVRIKEEFGQIIWWTVFSFPIRRFFSRLIRANDTGWSL